LKKLISFLLLLFSFSTVHSQQFGFGCLGLVGVSAGYEFQRYEATGLNNWLKNYKLFYQDSLNENPGEFGNLSGVRIGINFFRKNFSGFVTTIKGFYSDLNEKREGVVSNFYGNTSTKFEVKITQAGVGLDLGTTITGILSWKVIDAALIYNSLKLTTTVSTTNNISSKSIYENTGNSIGYLIGSGFILNIVGQYISLEGMAGYSSFKIDKIKLVNGDYSTTILSNVQTEENFITNGGISAIIQINFSFPL